jgi:hypothetical protein
MIGSLTRLPLRFSICPVLNMTVSQFAFTVRQPRPPCFWAEMRDSPEFKHCLTKASDYGLFVQLSYVIAQLWFPSLLQNCWLIKYCSKRSRWPHVLPGDIRSAFRKARRPEISAARTPLILQSKWYSVESPSTEGQSIKTTNATKIAGSACFDQFYCVRMDSEREYRCAYICLFPFDCTPPRFLTRDSFLCFSMVMRQNERDLIVSQYEYQWGHQVTWNRCNIVGRTIGIATFWVK